MNLGPCATTPDFSGGAVSICDLIRQHVIAIPHTTNPVVQRHLAYCSACQAFITQRGITLSSGVSINDNFFSSVSTGRYLAIRYRMVWYG